MQAWPHNYPVIPSIIVRIAAEGFSEHHYARKTAKPHCISSIEGEVLLLITRTYGIDPHRGGGKKGKMIAFWLATAKNARSFNSYGTCYSYQLEEIQLKITVLFISRAIFLSFFPSILFTLTNDHHPPHLQHSSWSTVHPAPPLIPPPLKTSWISLEYCSPKYN